MAIFFASLTVPRRNDDVVMRFACLCVRYHRKSVSRKLPFDEHPAQLIGLRRKNLLALLLIPALHDVNSIDVTSPLVQARRSVEVLGYS